MNHINKMSALVTSFDLFNNPFRPEIPFRILLYPIDGFLLTRHQFDALGATSLTYSDTNGLCVITESLNIETPEEAVKSYSVNLQNYSSYRHLADSGCVLEENALLPESGSWIVLVSQEDFAVLGCSRLFYTKFSAYYPGAAGDLAKFITAWERNSKCIESDISWLPSMVAHLTNST